MLLFGNGSADTGVGLAMASIDTVITDHLKVFFRDVSDEPFDEVHGRNGLVNKDIIFVSVVVEGNGISKLVIGVNTGRGNHGTAEIAADIVEDSRGTAFVAFSVNVEAILGVAVNGSFEAFEIWGESALKEIEQDSLESLAKESVVEVRNSTPEAKLIDTAFRDKTVNVRIPF